LDVPPSQYRVIERGGRLIVLESRTNRPPKRASEMMPTHKEMRTAIRVENRGDKVRERLLEALEEKSAAAPREETPPPSQSGASRPEPPMASPAEFAAGLPTGTIVGITVFMIAIAVAIGGPAGFFLAAVVIIIAGNLMLKSSVGKKAGER
jgi:hypothetical protein